MNYHVSPLLFLLALSACTPVPQAVKSWKGSSAAALEQHWGPYRVQTRSGNNKVLTYMAYFERRPSGLPRALTTITGDGREVFYTPPKEILSARDLISCDIRFELENDIVVGAASDGLACRYLTSSSGAQRQMKRDL
jgi:hypothetical protein